MYLYRTIEKRLFAAAKQFPVCLVTGPRQAGKSTLLKHCFPEARYVTLDHPLLRELAQKDPELFLSTHPTPLIIDEIQYAPGLLSYIKIRVDEQRHLYGQYLLAGSQIFQVMKGVTETLAGRIAIFELYPFSWEEIGAISDFSNLAREDLGCAEQMTKGFYPEFFIQPNLDKNMWLSSYLTTYIERDIRNLKAISDLSRFQTFIGLLAARAGQLLNMSEIAKETGVSQSTIKDWISLLETTYIIHILKPYHANLSKRLVKSPKIYFVDTGLLCYLLGIDSADRLLKAAERGCIFENMVVMEYLKRLSTRSEKSECYFYRTAAGVEVDLIVVYRNTLSAYEIKFAKTISKEAVKGLQTFQKDIKIDYAALLSLQEQTIPLTSDIVATHWTTMH